MSDPNLAQRRSLNTTTQSDAVPVPLSSHAAKRRSRLEQRYYRAKTRLATTGGTFLAISTICISIIFLSSVALTVILSLSLYQLNTIERQVEL